MEGCPSLGRAKVFTAEQGLDASLKVQLTDRNGAPLDLASIDGFVGVSEDAASEAATGVIAAKFREAALSEQDGGVVYASVTPSVDDVDEATVLIPIPIEISRDPGIYIFEIGVVDETGSTVHIERGLLSIEASLFRPVGGTLSDGPPTLMDVRMALRDHVDDNLRIGEVEFSVDEIVTALVRPIREWNESRPPLPLVSTKNFPYREQWLRAVTAFLLIMASDWYRRVYAKAQGGGLNYDRYNKERDYLSVGQQLLLEWRHFVRRTKISIAVQASFGSYGHGC